MEYDNTNRGRLFKNDRRTKETQPTHKGDLNVNGVEFWLSAWSKTSQAGNKYLSISVAPKEEQSAPAPQSTMADDFDDDVPF